MNKTAGKTVSLISAAIMLFALFIPCFAEENAFDTDYYAAIVTCSDVQGTATEAYDRYNSLLSLMKKDGLTTPDAQLVGGDFTKVLFDYAAPGLTLIRTYFTTVFPEADADSVVAVQGNHDNPMAGFVKTGFYDMGKFCLYAVNEDNFQWKQSIRIGDAGVGKLAADIDKNLAAMVEAGDKRPVIVLTHVPLHYTTRDSGKDNKNAALIFDVLSKYGDKLDITMLFGHNHSSDYDDYIGGAVNFMKTGDSILIPDGKGGYTERTLNFTYTNCGYVGYSGNSDTETSTSTLTLGAILISEDSIRYVKYSEDGLYRFDDVERLSPDSEKTDSGKNEAKDNLTNKNSWEAQLYFFNKVFSFFIRTFGAFSC